MKFNGIEILEEPRTVIQVERILPLDQAQLWEWVTKPELTGRWIGPWVRLNEENLEITLIREAGNPTAPARILEVNEQTGYTLELGGMGEPWLILVTVSPSGNGRSLFTIIQPVDAEDQAGAIRAGWEFYADCLAAAIDGREMPTFETYWDPES